MFSLLYGQVKNFVLFVDFFLMHLQILLRFIPQMCSSSQIGCRSSIQNHILNQKIYLCMSWVENIVFLDLVEIAEMPENGLFVVA